MRLIALKFTTSKNSQTIPLTCIPNSPCWSATTGRDRATAERSLKLFEKLGGVNEAREQVIIAAQGYGFFSVWMTVFEDYPEVK